MTDISIVDHEVNVHNMLNECKTYVHIRKMNKKNFDFIINECDVVDKSAILIYDEKRIENSIKFKFLIL